MTTPSRLQLIASVDRPALVRLANGKGGELSHAGAHLLSDDDLDEINRYGVPCGPRPDLVQHTGGRIAFTDVGRQYYQLAMRQHGVDAVLESVTDKAGLIDLHAEIFGAVRRKLRTQLHVEYDAGRVEPKDREVVEARLFGSVADLVRAMRRHLQFQLVGQNIISVSFKKKRRS
jgi:hypothetical protein